MVHAAVGRATHCTNGGDIWLGGVDQYDPRRFRGGGVGPIKTENFSKIF